MTTRVVAGEVWPEITKLCRGRGKRRAAIAYLGAAAPEQLLPLRSGDVLVVNAGDQALLSHATSPDALQVYLDAGVHIRSTRQLHAKVLVTPTHAVIGSANASTSSTGLAEAVVITDSARARSQAQRFIDNLAETTEVDQTFIDLAWTTWNRGRSAGPPGTGDRSLKATPFIAARAPVVLTADEGYTPSKSERDVVQRASRSNRRAAGPASTYRIGTYATDPGEPTHEIGTVIVSVYEEDGTAWVDPPRVVLTEPYSIPRVKHVVQLVREQVDLDPIELVEAKRRLRKKGVDADLEWPRRLRSERLRRAVVGLWGLKPGKVAKS